MRFRRRKFAGLLLIPKSGRLMGAVAKWLTRRVSTTAQSDVGASGEAIRLTAAGRVDLRSLVTDVFPLKSINEAFGRAFARDGSLKVQIEMA